MKVFAAQVKEEYFVKSMLEFYEHFCLFQRCSFEEAPGGVPRSKRCLRVLSLKLRHSGDFSRSCAIAATDLAIHYWILARLGVLGLLSEFWTFCLNVKIPLFQT